MEKIAAFAQSLRARLNAAVLGAEEAVEELVAALLADGHVLIEGAPGIGKTTLVKTLAEAVSGGFQRVQFTPDLLPSDLLGHSLYRQDEGRFEFVEGPVFTNLLLADEVNRTSPRVQSALLECMNEGQVTVDGTTRPLPEMFHVVATQNNRYASGTFPLPEPQLDRFLASVEMRRPESGVRAAILQQHAHDPPDDDEPAGIVASMEEFAAMKQAVRELPVTGEIRHYLVRLAEAADGHPELEGEISNRGLIALMRLAQAFAAMEGHGGVYPEDAKRALLPALAHRLAPAEGNGDESPSWGRSRVVAALREVLGTVAV